MTHSLFPVPPLLDALHQGLRAHLARREVQAPLMVGIYTGGAWVAEALHARLGLSEPLGTLDIGFYRDDFTRIGMNPQVRPSHLPGSVDDRHVILVDDVLYTGRTVRAALNELFDYGRPASVTLAVLVDRGGRELPVQADVAALTLALSPRLQIKLEGPDPLRLALVEVGR